MAKQKLGDPTDYSYRVKKVTKIVDGDTIDVLLDMGFDILYQQRVRLFGIDTPESRTRDSIEKKFGYLAKDMVESFLPVGSIQTLVTVKDKAGKFGRILGKFKIHDGKEDRQTTINEWMIENHYAVAYFGQSKEAIADEHLINYEKVIENVDLTESELALYINSRT